MLLILTNKKTEPVSKERVTEEIRKGLIRQKIKVEVRKLRDLEVFMGKKGTRVLIKKRPLKIYDMVYFRKVAGLTNAVYIIAETARRNNIYFIDKFRSRTNTRGKLVQMFQFSLHGLSIPKTYYSPEYDEGKIRSAIAFLKMPTIVKATHLGGGKMIYLAKNKAELKRILSKHAETEMILQEFIPNDLEYRIMVFENKASVAEKKIRVNKKEFRSNSRFGTKEIFINMDEVPQDLKKISARASQIMDIQVAGVDIIKGNNGKYYLTEINTAPGLSLDVEESNELEELVKYLTQCAKKTS
jgi:ribosomal protein S6--L-glutamate ligase